MDFKDLASRLGIDDDDFMELVELFVTTTFSDIDKIKKGVKEGSPQDAAAASHSIKGASGNLGFDEIFNLTRDMEMQAKKGSLENFETYVCDLERMVNALKNI
ncbi:MAG: Hpt domain-containing protein [Proteobacteria bacterium]|nr:Hpt domain-containing protein [Pseudomonadota bacterium]MBU1582386.1 Hpt domain-containing protein [Pseudomonadota bacterium]MBU2452170.1 Hpt domain-containing protein [Pseudomonadota bacterium]MBU2631805.1 Hpt domain-containing protein [Pseudomonadota bacterium]